MSIDIDKLEALANRVNLWGQSPTILELIDLLRAAEAREQALAAQILVLADALEDAEAPDAEAGDMWDASQCADWIREQSPTTTLTKRDLIKQAEALEEAADQLPNSHPVAIGLRNQAAELRRQAEGE